ncbi:MAG: MFS transporter [Flavobacteriales bacterium]|nr:MFS transporter [Flavobacteriales bacterium]
MDRRLVVLFITIFIDLVGFGIFIPVVPFVARELGASDALVGDTSVVFSLLMYAFGPFWGAVSDRFGRRPVIFVAVAISAVSYLLFSFAGTVWVLMLSRMLTGVGSANIAAAQAYITDITPMERRAKSLGMVGAAFGLGFIFGPPLGGLVYDAFGAPAVGYMAFGLCVINLAGIWFFLPESHTQRDTKAPIRFAPITATIKSLRDARFRDIYLIGFIYLTAFAMMQTAVPLLWKDDYGLTEAQVSYMFAAVGLASAIVQGGLLGFLTRRFSEAFLITWGCVLVSIGLAGTCLVPKEHFIPLSFVPIAFLALGNGVLWPSLATILTRRAMPQEQGQVLGMNQSFGSLGRIAGPLMAGRFYQVWHLLPFLGGSVIMLGALVYVRAFLAANARSDSSVTGD